MKVEGLILTALSPRLAIVHVKLAVFPANIVTVSGPVDRIVADDTRELSDCNGCFDLLCEKNPATEIRMLCFQHKILYSEDEYDCQNNGCCNQVTICVKTNNIHEMYRFF